MTSVSPWTWSSEHGDDYYASQATDGIDAYVCAKQYEGERYPSPATYRTVRSFFRRGRVFAILWGDPEPEERVQRPLDLVAARKRDEAMVHIREFLKTAEAATRTLKRVGSVSYAIRGLIRDSRQNELVSNALADYCAKHNFLSLRYAEQLGLQIEAHKATNVTIGSGQRIKTLGTTTTRFSFRGEPTAYDLTFHVLPKCIRDVVLGKRFLKDTHTLRDKKKFASRVVERFSLNASKHKLFFLGDSAPAFTGSLNGMAGKALADIGSSVLVMDEDYALGLSLPMHRSPRTRLLFADGSKKYTTGVTKGMRWQFGPEKDAESHHLDFHILQDAPAPVILSDTFYDDDDSDVDILADEEMEAVEDVDGYFCHITIDPTHYPQGHVDFSSIPNRRHAETCLRSQIRSRIAKLPQREQMARQAETKRQEEWQRDMDILEQAQTASTQQQTQTQPNPLAPGSTQTPVPSGKRKSLWLRLKRQKGQK